MALLRLFENLDYLPDHGTLYVCDADRHLTRPRVDPLLAEHATEAAPCGTIARAGDGWLDGPATDAYHDVFLEAHDQEPPDDTADWTAAAAVETPMATSGVVGLMMITSPGTRDPFRIGPAGFYRVRVCRRKPANVFRLQFWPASPPEPPRWLVRDEPPIRSHDHEATRYGAAASDVVVAILWARECGVAPTPQWLTQRLLLSPETLDEILGYAARAGLVVTDDPGSFAVAPRRPVRQPFRPVAVRPATPRPETPRPETPRPAPTPAEAAALDEMRRKADAAREQFLRRAGVQRPGEPRPEPSPGAEPWSVIHAVIYTASTAPQPLPLGAPLRAGVVSRDGRVTVWRDGQPTTLGVSTPGTEQTYQALQTRHGVLLLRAAESALLRPDGLLDLLGPHLGWPAAVDPSGDHVALFERHLGRNPMARLHLIDLASGDRGSLDWPSADDFPVVIALRDGTVFGQSRAAGGAGWSWRPGSAIESLPLRVVAVDPVTGAMAGHDQRPGVVVARPDGTTSRVDVSGAFGLAPGARALMQVDYEPPALRLIPVDGGEPTRIPLPQGVRPTLTAPMAPVWETESHLLSTVAGDHRLVGAPVVRLDVRTGAIEGVPLGDVPPHQVVLIQPLLP